MNEEQPDPKLQKAAAEISAILKKHDIGGYIMLASKTHGEYVLNLPTWSKCQIENVDGEQRLRFKAKGKDEDSSVVGTVHMLQVFIKLGKGISNQLDNVLELVESKMFISGGPKKI